MNGSHKPRHQPWWGMETPYHTQSVEEILRRLTQKLSNEVLGLVIDARLDAAADSFAPNPKAAANASAFRSELARFVQHLALDGIYPPRHLSESEAFGEALDLLAAIYFTSRDVALEDAEADIVLDKPDALHQLLLRAFRGATGVRQDRSSVGIDSLNQMLAAMLGEMKRRRRAEHWQWVITRTIGPLDWSEQCSLADAIRSIYGDALPNSMGEWASGRLASYLPQLLAVHLGAVRQEQELFEQRRFR